jgi:hypothetical protein
MRIELVQRWILILSLFLVSLDASANQLEKLAKTLQEQARNCVKQSAIDHYLERAWQELPVARGRLDNGNESTFYSSRSGTWTLIEHRINGLACVIASGKQFKLTAKPKI